MTVPSGFTVVMADAPTKAAEEQVAVIPGIAVLVRFAEIDRLPHIRLELTVPADSGLM